MLMPAPITTFELDSRESDGHIKALTRAILLNSRMSKEALLDFTPDKVRVCAKSDLFLLKFRFSREFFTHYHCDRRYRCFINAKALLHPFKSAVLLSDASIPPKIRCVVDESHVTFIIGAGPNSAELRYQLNINDMDPHRNSINAINRTIEYWRVNISPKQGRKDKFLLSAFNNFATDMDQVTIRASPSEVKFIGSTSPMYPNQAATSEFTHKRDDFHDFNIREELNITVPLKFLKLYLHFVEVNKIQMNPNYIFEGLGQPAHFIYSNTLMKAHFISSTSIEFVPEAIMCEPEIHHAFEDASFIEDVIQGDEEEDNEDGYHENESDEELLDGNLDRLTTLREEMSHIMPSNHNNLDKIREIINIDQDPDDIENVEVRYSSSDESG